MNKLNELESMIRQLQYEVNDNKTITNIDDIKMEIFKLWYYVHTDKKYDVK